jgi:hypothetical protein
MNTGDLRRDLMLMAIMILLIVISFAEAAAFMIR